MEIIKIDKVKIKVNKDGHSKERYEVKAYDCNKKNMLIWASTYGHLEVVKLLIASGADIHAVNNKSLRYASRNGHLEIAKLLIANDADVRAAIEKKLKKALTKVKKE